MHELLTQWQATNDLSKRGVVSLFLKDSGAHRAQKQLNQEWFDSKDAGYLKAISKFNNRILKSSQRGLKLWHFSGSSEPQLLSKKSSCLLQVVIDVGYGYGCGYDCGLWHHAPLESVQWPPPVRFSTSGITSGKVIPLKTPPFGCKYSTGEDHIVCQGCSYFCQIRKCT